MVINIYHAKEIHIKQVDADNESNILTNEIRPIPVSIMGADEQVVNIERSNRIVKEHTRSYVHRLPYKIYTIKMVFEYMVKSVKDLNAKVAKGGISEGFPPGTLITGRANPSYMEVQALNFGEFMHVHDPADTTNTNKPRTT